MPLVNDDPTCNSARSMCMSSTASRQTEQVFQNFIAGQWRPSESGETFVSTNPAHTSEIIGYYQKSTPADLEAAIDAAANAQRAWAALPAPERGEVLRSEEHTSELQSQSN